MHKDYFKFKEFYDRYEPYHYFDTYLRAYTKYHEDRKLQSLFDTNPDDLITQKRFLYLGSIGFHLKECKIIQISDEILPLIEDTKPDFSELKMPYPAMFVNRQFRVGEFRINGFLIVDVDWLRSIGFEIDKNSQESSIMVLSVALNTEGGYEFYSLERLEEKFHDDKTYDENDDMTKEDKKEMTKGARYIINLATNLINTINNYQEEVETVSVEYTEEQNRKRIKRGKHPHRNKLVLRLTGKLKEYAEHYRRVRREVSVKFLVRGHWRHFKSERFHEDVRDTKKWIYPHYRGIDKADELHKRFVELR